MLFYDPQIASIAGKHRPIRRKRGCKSGDNLLEALTLLNIADYSITNMLTLILLSQPFCQKEYSHFFSPPSVVPIFVTNNPWHAEKGRFLLKTE